MIGYYVHHVGRGHLQRARAVTRHLADEVTVLSTLPRPADWTGGWVALARDDDGPAHDVTAGGRLHWVPRRHAGLASRMAAVAGWIAACGPRALVSDVSVEVAVLARSLGVPVVAVALPGDRSDAAHQLAFDVADLVLAPWPDLDPRMCPGLEPHRAKLVHAGGISRFDDRIVERRREPGPRRALVLAGAGGGERTEVTGHGWRITQRGPGSWVEDPWPELCAADVVVSHCGLGALADIAAARRPAVLVPQARPHDEQATTARVIDSLGAAVVADGPRPDWDLLLDAAHGLDPDAWSAWSDGRGAERAAAAIASVAAAP